MASPDYATYEENPDGFFTKKTDRSGPYAWDGTTMLLVASGASGASSVTATGNVASGAADSGNPIKTGGVYTAVLPTLTDGQRGNTQLTTKGATFTSLNDATNGNPVTTAQGNADALNGAPVLLGVAAKSFVYNGATWDRVRGDATGGAWSQGAVASGATDSGNPIKIGGRYNTTPPTFTDGQRGDFQMGSRGALNVTLYNADTTTALSVLALNADSQPSVGVGLTVRALNYKFNGTTYDRETKANLVSRIVSAAASTNATSAKASTGTLKSILGYNAAATVKYLKLYNKASAPTVGTDTPIMTIALAPSKEFNITGLDMYFSTGIAYAITGAAADADTTNLVAADVVGLNLTYA